MRCLGRRFAFSQEPILVCGESGTGKELVAQALHMASQRSDRPFVTVNCAALPPELMESELFGYETGAFTGAKVGGVKGKFEMADTGTIFWMKSVNCRCPCRRSFSVSLKPGKSKR